MLTPAQSDLLGRVLQQALSIRLARLALVAPAHEARRIQREIEDIESLLLRLDDRALADLRPQLARRPGEVLRPRAGGG